MTKKLNQEPQLNKHAVMRSFYKRNEFICNFLTSLSLFIYVNTGNPIRIIPTIYRHAYYIVYC